MSESVSHQPHICLYIGSLQKGGAERVMTNLAEYLYDQGWRVTFVTTYFRPPEYELPHALWDPQTGEPYDLPDPSRAAEKAPGALHGDGSSVRAGKVSESYCSGTARDVSAAPAGEDAVRWGSRTVQMQPSGIRRIYSDPPAEELAKGRVHGFLARYRTLRAIWRKERPDVILSFIGYNNSFAILTSRGLHIPVVISVRSNPAYEYDTAKLRIPAFALFRQADGVVLQTREAARFFPKAVQRRSVILPNALNPDFLQPRYEGPRGNRVVAVGRLDENKNQGYLIEQFALAHARHPEYTLHLYGDGPSREKFKALAASLGIADAVIFEGQVSNVRRHIETARIFVLPSKTEGMPNALLEAMAAGLACISTDCPCGGPRELIEDGANGFLVPLPPEAGEQIKTDKISGTVEKTAGADSAGVSVSSRAGLAAGGNPPTMADRLLQLMDDPELADRMGREAARVQESHSPEKVNAQWQDYLAGFVTD